MYKNKKMATFVASVCALSIVSCSVGIVSFADEENVISNENFETMESVESYVVSNQGKISIDGDLDFTLNNSFVDDAGFFTEDITLDIPISIDDNPAFTEANMNLSIINQEGVELDYTIGAPYKNGLFYKKTDDNIHLFSKEEFALNDTLFVVNVTIPKNMIKSGSEFEINLSNVELINGDNKYIPSFPERTFIRFSIVGSPIEDTSADITTSIGQPIKDTTTTELTTTTPPQGTTSESQDTTTTKYTTTTRYTTGEPQGTTTTRITTTTKFTSTEPNDTTTTIISKNTNNNNDTTTTTKISKKDTDSSKSNTSGSTKGNTSSSKASSSKESTSVEKEEKSMDTGSNGILGIIVAGFMSISTAVAIRKKS